MNSSGFNREDAKELGFSPGVVATLGVSALPGVGPVTLRQLGEPDQVLDLFTCEDVASFESVLNAKGAKFSAQGAGISGWQDLRERVWRAGLVMAAELMKHRISCITPSSALYPARLSDLGARRPNWLFLRGNTALLGAPSVAVVGTREPSDTGEFLTRYAVSLCREFGLPVVSGLAKGIDSVAHDWSLKLQLPTISVLGSGLLVPYPAKNIGLAEKIVQEGGLLISEYLPRQQPAAEMFVWRNRIQACIAETVIATEWRRATVHYVGQQIGMPPRQRAGSVNPILQKFDVKLEETVLVGARDEDLQAGVNNKLLLLRPAWYENDLGYGFELKSIEELGRFCLLFGTRTHPFYWQVNDAERGLQVNALGPFSTLIQAFAKFGEDAKNAAKYETGTLVFWHQLITSTLYFSGLIHKVNLITVYPGHAAGKKDKAFYEVLDLLGKCFNKPFCPDLLLRHEDAIKSSFQKAGDRKFSNQVNTLRLNRYPSKYGGAPRKTPINLAGKSVLIVDDICTSGRSLDSARAYMVAAGASAVLFCWLKTINTDYLSMEPAPKLAPFEKNIIATEPKAKTYGYSTNIVDPAAAQELDHLLKQFQTWKV